MTANEYLDVLLKTQARLRIITDIVNAELEKIADDITSARARLITDEIQGNIKDALDKIKDK